MTAEPLEFLNALRDVILVHDYDKTYAPRLINQEDGSNMNLFVNSVGEAGAHVVDFSLSCFLHGELQLTYIVRRFEVSYQDTIESIITRIIVNKRYEIQMTEIE